MKHDHPNLNEGKHGSKTDLVDLRNAISFGTSVEDIAASSAVPRMRSARRWPS